MNIRRTGRGLRCHGGRGDSVRVRSGCLGSPLSPASGGRCRVSAAWAEARPGQGTPTSGRHSPPQAGGTAYSCLGRSAAGAGNADLRSAQPAAGGRNCVQLSCGVSPTSTTALVEVRVAVRTIPLFDVRPVRCAARSVADRRSAFPDRRRYPDRRRTRRTCTFAGTDLRSAFPRLAATIPRSAFPCQAAPPGPDPSPRTIPPPPSFPIRNYCAEETASPNTLSHADADAPRTSNRMRPHPPKPPLPHPSAPATILPGRRGVAQSGRAPGSGSGGRRFKSCRPDAARPSGRVPGPKAATASGPFGRTLSAPSERGSGCLLFCSHPWVKTCIFLRSCRARFVPASAPFLALAS